MVLGLVAIVGAALLVLSAMGVLSSKPTGVARSLQAIQTLGAAPEEIQKEISPSFSVRVLEPLREKMIRLARKLTPADYTARIRHKLDVAGNPPGWSVDRVLWMKVAGLSVGLGGGILLTTSVGMGPMLRFVVAMGLALFGWVAVNVWVHNEGTKRTIQMKKDLPDALDLLTVSVEAGLGFDAAMAQVARNTTGPLAGEFARVLQEMQIGSGRRQAMRSLGERTTLSELRGFANALVQADQLGMPIGNVLRIQASEMRTKRRQWAEEKAQKVAVKVLFPLMFCILPVLFIVVLGPAAINALSH